MIGKVVSFGLINYPIYYSVQVAVKHGKIICNVGTIQFIFKGYQNTLNPSTCFLIIRYNLESMVLEFFPLELFPKFHRIVR